VSTLSSRLFSNDLNFLIGETEEQFTGVTPSSISGIVYKGCLSRIDSGYEVFEHGHEITLDSSILINSENYNTLPSKGAVLRDLSGTLYKVFEVEKEDFGGGYTMKVNSQYARST
tara:strand:- start:1014 stop:1358 length:345 start_codon:yes stop_codon:yes gene_type:complete